MSAILNAASITGRIGAGSILLADYLLEIQPIENGYRMNVTRGSEVQTMDVLDGVGIVGIEKTGSTGDVDSYRVTFTDGSTFDYTVETNSAAHAAAEAARVEAENSRVSAEVDRVSAEAGRADAEAAREASEYARESAETARASAESARAQAEDGRQSAEAARVAAEQSRASAESVRAAAENARVAAETARSNAENERAGAETLRAAAEADRANAESGRVSAEQGRVSAESERAAAEEARAAEFAGFSGEITQLKDDVAAITPDDTVVDGKPWTSKKIVDSLCQPFEEMGNPVQVYPVEGYPLGVKLSWEPTQAGSGDPSPDNIRPISGRDAVSVTRCGRNLSQTNAIGNITWATRNANVTKLINKLPVGTYRISFTITLNKFSDNFTSETAEAKGLYAVYIVYDGSASYGRHKILGVVQSIYRTDTLPISHNVIANFTITEEDAGYKKEITFYACGRNTYAEGAPNGALGTAEVSNLQIELGSADTTYEPYTGSTTDIALPETVYGGTLDVETGVVTVDTICETVTGAESSRFIDEPFDKQFSFVLKKTSDSGISSHYKSLSSDDKNNGVFGVYLNTTYKAIFNSGFDTLDDFKAYLSTQNAAGTPIQLCYKILDPYTIQLTPQQIAALSGVNTLYTDAGTLTVTGREDPQHTITELKNAIISLGGNI